MVARCVERLVATLWVGFLLLFGPGGPGGAEAAICREAVCSFTLDIRQQRTMIYKGPQKRYDVTLNGTRLQVIGNSENHQPDDVIGSFVDAADVITADGYKRTVVTVNGQFPGPPLEIIQGSQVAVHVRNRLIREVLTIHWHGLPMRNTQWMDGVPHVTQCPLLAGQDFTYRFIAEPVGTHWYHSHIVGQRTDGLYGMIVIHPRVAASPPLPEMHLLVGDWFHFTGDEIETVSPSSGETANRGTGENVFANFKSRDFSHDGVNNAALLWQSGLINGRGRHASKQYPLTTFHVTRGTTYRFRTINVGAEFSLQVSIDNHILRVVSSDGHNFEPITVKYILIHPGESIDFEVTTNQIEGRYWLRAETLHDYQSYATYDSKRHWVNAVFLYEHISGDLDPKSMPSKCTASAPCKVFNCPFGSYPPSYNRTCINLPDLTSTLSAKDLADNYGVDDTDVHEIFLNIGYNNKSSVNGRRMIQPSAPLYQEDANIVDCEAACADFTKSCACTHIIRLPFNKTVQAVISNYQGVSYVGHHPVHFHGHKFAVMHIGYANHHRVTGRWFQSNDDLTCHDGEVLCRNIGWTNGAPPTFKNKQPVLKDTVIVPARGYTVVRFRTTNPGYWLMHCHMNHHIENGMALVFEEAVEYIPPPPPSFPTCHHFFYSADQFLAQATLAAKYLKLGPGVAASQASEPLTTQQPLRPDDGKRTTQCMAKDGFTYINSIDLMGTAIGCVVLGFVISLVSIILYMQCMKRKANEEKAGLPGSSNMDSQHRF